MASNPIPFLTPEQYLEIERKAEFRSEYFRGEMFAMAGATEPHNMIAGNVFGQARQQLRSGPCRAYHADMRIRTATGLNTYPDIVIVCAPLQFLDDTRDTLRNPAVIVEVLSPSTEAYDRGRKFEHYRSIESLREYLLIASDRMSAMLYRRQSEHEWLSITVTAPDGVVELESAQCRINLARSEER